MTEFFFMDHIINKHKKELLRVELAILICHKLPTFFFPGHYANIAIIPQDALFTRPSRLINVPTIQQPKHPLRKEVPLCLITAEMKF